MRVSELPTQATSEPKMNWSDIRADFPILDQKVHGRPLIYFDNAATTQKPRQVLDALNQYYRHGQCQRPPGYS